MENKNLDIETLTIVTKALGVKEVSDIINRDFKDITPEHDVDREKEGKYRSRVRGSIRLSSGRYYTANEYADRINKIRSIRLP